MANFFVANTQYFSDFAVYMSEMDEQELAIRCHRGDNAARRELYETYSSRLLSLCRRYVADTADAEDLMQDAFVKIFRVIGRFRWTRPGSLYSWMARVALNLAFDSARRRKRLARELVDVDTLKGEIIDEPDYEQTLSVPGDVLREMVAALPEGYRTVFELYCFEELSHKEIADLLGIKEKSSSASLARARAQLARAIRQYLDKGVSSGRSGASVRIETGRRSNPEQSSLLM